MHLRSFTLSILYFDEKLMIFRSWLCRVFAAPVAACGGTTGAPLETFAALRVRFEGSIRWLDCSMLAAGLVFVLVAGLCLVTSGGRFACWFRKVAG